MSEQICPKCKTKAFTWYIDEEKSKYTNWVCSECQYETFEDEEKETYCLKCKTEHPSLSYLFNNKEKYWWCSSCSLTKNIE